MKQFQTRGVAFTSVPGIEQVGDRWSEIVDLEGAVPGADPAG
ncbi:MULTISPECIES: hypothetical protein [unclassified Pseudonocardia]|nr:MULTISPECIES: hypothetical protein [unclassified Pseudonocardia]